ncbi:MAG: SDR family oxidoreductase [SAR202 cluster bacterium]|nr:SDR family oxidoreductase [SAR202 cluster bacterium]
MLDSRAQSQGIGRDEIEKNITQNVAIKRAIDPKELAWLVTYLSSPKAECITGEVIAAGGGAMGGVHQ